MGSFPSKLPPPYHSESNIREHDGTELLAHHLDVVDMPKHAGNTLTRHESAPIQIQRMDDVIKKLPFNRTFVLEQIRTPATLPSSSNKSNSCNKLDGTDLLIHRLDVSATLSLSVSVLFVFVDRQTCTSTKDILNNYILRNHKSISTNIIKHLKPLIILLYHALLIFFFLHRSIKTSPT